MHVHISWAHALVILLTFVAVIGSLNMLARTSPNSTWAGAWRNVSSAG